MKTKKKTKQNSEKYLGLLKYGSVTILMIIGILYVYLFQGGKENFYLILGTIFAIYMLLNLGANDVANNVGPAVGSKALTIFGALVIAVIFEAAGAIFAGGDVTGTIKSGIVDRELIESSKQFIIIMLATLLGSAIWTNLATFLRAPVSVTNSVIGALIGAGLIAAGPEAIKWAKVGEIGASWIISLLLGGIIAVTVYTTIRKNILKTEHKGKAAKKWVPVYVGIIIGVFFTYLLLKGLKPILKTNEAIASIITPTTSLIAGIIFGILTFIGLKIKFSKQKKGFFKDDKSFVNKLFNVPLAFAVCLLCFAHGSNDVANAIGPLAAIYETIHETSGEISTGVPLWIMILGGIGLSTGLAVFGARLVKTVGKSITKIDQLRAFCIALSTASTVLIASTLGLPVSSTQITLGAVFGIGLFRQYLCWKRKEDKKVINLGMMRGILLSWVVTLPISGLLSAATYFILMKF